MKKHIILIAAMLLWGAAAIAQQTTPHFAIAQFQGKSTIVYTDDGRSFEVDGKLVDLDMDGETVWTLTTGAVNYIYNNMICNDFRVYKNDKRRKTYKGNADERYFSMALRVKDGHVIIAGSKISAFNKRGFESCLFGEVDFERVFETEYVRKSLKRDNFRGFAIVKNGKTVVPEYDVDGTSALSVFYGVKDVDYYKGNIYASGWGEREYTQTMGTKYYFVRRCPRVWKNGKEYLQQYENQTGAAYSINVLNVNGKKHVLTSGHNRGTGSGWDGSKEMYTYPSGEFAIDEEAVIANGSYIYRCGVVNRDHLCFVIQSENSAEIETMMDGVDYDCVFYDVVADPDNMDFYLLASPYNSNDLEVWRLHCTGSTLKAPKKVFTFHIKESGSLPKLAISK